MEESLMLPVKSSPFSTSAAEEHKPEHEELLIQSLPKEKGWFTDTGRTLYQDFWCPTHILQNVISFQKHFQAHDQDIILASNPKSGATWLKALIFSILSRSHYALSSSPLLSSNSHELVPFFEFTLYAKTEAPDFTTMSSPRLFSTHIPYASLPESIKHSKCRIVYVCRNPFDIVVSSYHFATQSCLKCQWTMEEFVENFCEGKDGFGPFWNHVLGYWNESLEKPDKVLFLKFEDLKEDTIYQLKRLAEFIGFPFSLEEERQGVIENITKLCSLNYLKDLEVNKNGKFMPNFENKYFFRKGDVGDWVNHFSPSMIQSMNRMIEEKFTDSGLTFKLLSS